jgi:large subunit ribosomal protein L35
MKLKQKTRKIVAKRFKITATGKVMRRSVQMRHLRRNKNKDTIRKYRKYQEVTGKIAKKIKQMLHN